MKNYKRLKAKLLKDKQIKKTYGELGSEFELIHLIIQRRISRGFTQNDLAKRIGTKQSAISRLESGTYNPSLSFLRKVAAALDARVEILIH